jgi:hypothetical protein
MSTGAQELKQAPPTRAAGELEWTIWLLTRHPWKGLLAIGVGMLTIWFTLSLTGSTWLGGIAAFILLASLSHFFLPTRYHLDEKAVRVSNILYWRRRPWSEFRGFARSGPRIKLLTLPPGSRLDNYRGMLLLLPEAPEEALAFIRDRLADPEPDGGESP